VIDYDTTYYSSEIRSVYYTNYNRRNPVNILNLSNSISVGTKMLKDDFSLRWTRKLGKYELSSRFFLSLVSYTGKNGRYYDYILTNTEISGKKRFGFFEAELTSGLNGRISENKAYTYLEYKVRLIPTVRINDRNIIRLSTAILKRGYRGNLYSSYYRLNPELSMELYFGELSNINFSLGYERQNVLNPELSKNNSMPYMRVDSQVRFDNEFYFIASISGEHKKYDEQDFIHYNYTHINSIAGVKYEMITWNISLTPSINYFYGDTFYFAEPYYEIGIQTGGGVMKRKKIWFDGTVEIGKREYFNQTELSFSTPYFYTNIIFNIKIWLKDNLTINAFTNYTPEWHKNPSDNFILTYISGNIRYEF
ncbi:MAG: hypothetical protein ACPL6C_02830, partial [bacterium]